jgi:hypothetical protein
MKIMNKVRQIPSKCYQGLRSGKPKCYSYGQLILGAGISKRGPKMKGVEMMKKRLLVLSVVVFAVVLGSAFLIAPGGELHAQETDMVVVEGRPARENVAAYMCDEKEMEALVAEDEDARDCMIKVISNNETARKMLVQRMLKNESVRGRIMDSIATTPALRSQMEAKLAATK